MSSRVQQTKQQQQSNAKLLRQLAKESGTCADCKRNDPRWASWNIGCFLCIRCSGIHRSMGTHISKVKSIDLDIWTPEQMDSIQKWGNRRANLYWEAHLKAGHSPPEHKVESFIRSKYETRRWAMEGPPPQDPAALDGGTSAVATAASASDSGTASAPQRASSSSIRSSTATSSSLRGAPANTRAPSAAIDLLGGDAGAASPAAPSLTRQPQSLFDDTQPTPSNGRQASKVQSSAPSQPAAPPATGGGGGLFDLDWHEPTPQASVPAATSRGKSDILSLFNNNNKASHSSFTSPTSPPSTSGFGGLEAFGGLELGGSKSSAPTTSTPAPSLWESTPTAASSTSTAPANAGAASADLFGSSNVWGSTSPVQVRQPSGSFGSSVVPQPVKPSTTPASNSADVWGDFATTTAPSSSNTGSAIKDDPFGDIWK